VRELRRPLEPQLHLLGKLAVVVEEPLRLLDHHRLVLQLVAQGVEPRMK